MKSESVYLLQDGTYAAKGDCKKGDDGVLRHENGLAVSMTSEGEPMTLEMMTEENEKAANAGKPDEDPDHADAPVPAEPAAPAPAEPEAPVEPAPKEAAAPKAHEAPKAHR